MTTLFLQTAVSAPNPTINLKCHTEQKNNGKIDIYAVWNVSYYPGILEAMERFDIHTQKVDHSKQIENVVEWFEAIEVVPDVRDFIQL